MDANSERMVFRHSDLGTDMGSRLNADLTLPTSPPPTHLQTAGVSNRLALSAFAGFVPSSSSAAFNSLDPVPPSNVSTEPPMSPPVVVASAPFLANRASRSDLVQPSAPAGTSRSADTGLAPIPDSDPVWSVYSSVTTVSSGTSARDTASHPAVVPLEKAVSPNTSVSANIGWLSKSSKTSRPNTRPCRHGCSCRFQDSCTFVHPAASSTPSAALVIPTHIPSKAIESMTSFAAALVSGSTSSKSIGVSSPSSAASAKSMVSQPSQFRVLSITDQFQAMSIKQLKEFLISHCIDFTECENKADFVALCVRATQSARVPDTHDYDCDSEVDEGEEDPAQLTAVAAASRAAAMAGKTPPVLLEQGYASKAQGNLELAAECFAKAAEAKRNKPVGAQFAYAMCVYEGEGVPEDKDAAIILLFQAADTEQCPQALSWLGMQCEKGRNRRISKDLALAFDLFKRCVAFKLPSPHQLSRSPTVNLATLQQSAVALAQFRLHKYFLNGTGGCCEVNPLQAQLFFDLALTHGSSDALAAVQAETHARAQEERRVARETARAREREARDRARKAEEERQWVAAAQRREREQREKEQRQREALEQRHRDPTGNDPHRHHHHNHSDSGRNNSYYDEFLRKLFVGGAVHMRMGPNGPQFCFDFSEFGSGFGFGKGQGHNQGDPDYDDEDGYDQDDDGYVGNIFANLDQHLPPHERFRRKYLSSSKGGSCDSSVSHFHYDVTREGASYTKAERDTCIAHVKDHAIDAPHLALCLTDAEIGATVAQATVVSSIKKHYRVLSLLVHPDKNSGNDGASDAFVALGVAQEKMLHCWR